VFDYEIALGNGNITLGSTSRIVTVDLGNGYTSADLILLDTCTVEFMTGNGNIDLSIPPSTNAYLDVSVGNGAGTIVLVAGNGNIELKSK